MLVKVSELRFDKGTVASSILNIELVVNCALYAAIDGS